MRTHALLLALFAIGACHGTARTLSHPVADARHARSALPAALARLNTELRRGAVRQSVFGQNVEDPYRALETDDAASRAWIDAQTARTEAALSALRDPKAEARLHELLSIGSIGEVVQAQCRAFFTLREAGRERPALYTLPTCTTTGAEQTPGPPIVDPESYGEHAAIDYIFPSPDGRFVAFGISGSGDECAILHVYDLTTRKVLADTLDHAKWSSIEWLHDDSGFYYSRYPKPGETSYDAKAEDSYFTRLFFHRLGSTPASDALVFAGTSPTDIPSARLDESDRYLTITNYRSFTASDLWLWDRGAAPAMRKNTPAPGELVAVVRDEDKETSGLVHQGLLYLLTNLGATHRRIVRVEPSRASDRAQWQTVVAESSSAITDWAITERAVAVHRIDDVRSKLSLVTLDGRALGEIELPMRGCVEELSATPQGQRITFVFSSYLQAPTLYTYDIAQPSLTRLHAVKSPFDAHPFELLQTHVKSQDGTEINVHYVMRRGLRHDGQNPVLLSGYGGFDVSLLPRFSRSALYFIERGGIYAEANLRGGGELGEDWHRAGMLSNKPRVFEDFEAVIRWFSQSGLSRPGRIAITGGSNGGLLMGAMISRAPETFAAATSYVGLYDMLRYPLFPPAALWTSEYGDPSEPGAASYLLAYSPYHNIRPSTVYPAVLIETADHDSRVAWAHSAKFAARLQDENDGPNPVYFYMEHEMGHGRGAAFSELLRRYSRQYAFILHALGMDAPGPR